MKPLQRNLQRIVSYQRYVKIISKPSVKNYIFLIYPDFIIYIASLVILYPQLWTKGATAPHNVHPTIYESLPIHGTRFIWGNYTICVILKKTKIRYFIGNKCWVRKKSRKIILNPVNYACLKKFRIWGRLPRSLKKTLIIGMRNVEFLTWCVSSPEFRNLNILKTFSLVFLDEKL